jgi:hypothetical protein
VHVSHFLDALAICPDIEIIEATLPDAIVDDIHGAFTRTIVILHVSQNTRDPSTAFRAGYGHALFFH